MYSKIVTYFFIYIIIYDIFDRVVKNLIDLNISNRRILVLEFKSCLSDNISIESFNWTL